MKIVKEKEETFVKMDIDFENDEYETLLEYGKKNIPVKELDDLILEWAFVKALKNGIKYHEKKKKERKRIKK